MDLRVIENLETELSIEIAGEDHTFMNVLKAALLEVDGVAAATYDMNPEQSGGQTDPIVTIKTDGSIEPLAAASKASRKASVLVVMPPAASSRASSGSMLPSVLIVTIGSVWPPDCSGFMS